MTPTEASSICNHELPQMVARTPLLAGEALLGERVGNYRELFSTRRPCPEFSKRGTHAGDGGIDVDETGAETDKVGIVSVDEFYQLGLECSEVGSEFGAKAQGGTKERRSAI
ncbi:hypothetical protein HPP92_006980 [Vanilla planifolia]|uniref:Uncharacterized protein n=1 Tax=Vanilla planifolia TaxID=51239 RepID=A0A835V5G3_VANPL|nr:hypothetical protein HPP92_006980 [Vanilla planifolia]